LKIAIPIESDLGLESKVYGHFGSAPGFLVYDTEAKASSVLANHQHQHAHGQCNPIAALAGQTVDALVTGGIGGRALELLNASRIRVFRVPEAGTAGDVVRCFEEQGVQGLQEITSSACCSGGGHGHGQGHGCQH